MDIQVASNFERLLFETSGRDSKAVADCYSKLKDEGGFEIPAQALAAMRAKFSAGAANDAEVAAKIRQLHASHNLLVDPHTCVGLVVIDKLRQELAAAAPGAPIVALSTAHAAKFPETILAETGAHPPLPAHCANLFERKEEIVRLPAKIEAIQEYLLQHARAAQ